MFLVSFMFKLPSCVCYWSFFSETPITFRFAEMDVSDVLLGTAEFFFSVGGLLSRKSLQVSPTLSLPGLSWGFVEARWPRQSGSATGGGNGIRGSTSRGSGGMLRFFLFIIIIKLLLLLLLVLLELLIIIIINNNNNYYYY